MRTLLSVLVLLVSAAVGAEPHPHSAASPQAVHPVHLDSTVTDQAPIGVSAGRLHGVGSLMVGLRYRVMGMSGLKDGSDDISQAELFDPEGPYDYSVLPTSMSTQMVMASAMYTPFRYLTVSAMVPYVFKEMDMITRTGKGFRTRANGVGDISLFLTSQWVGAGGLYAQAKMGLSFPSGSINQQDNTPMSGQSPVQLPYLMQMGSGTWDLLPSAMVGGSRGRLAWGLRVAGVVRTTTNANGYRFGDIYELTGWGEWAWTSWLAFSLRLAWQETFTIEGYDSRLPANALAMTPSANPDYLGRKQFDGFVGFQLLGQRGFFGGYGLALEAGLPLWQATTGPGLSRTFFVTLGVNRAF